MRAANYLPCGNGAQNVSPNIVCSIGLVNEVIAAVLRRHEAFLINEMARYIYKRYTEIIANLRYSPIKKKQICICQL